MAIVLAVIGVLAVLLKLQSPTSVLWTGRPVTATEVGGIVLYPFEGHDFTLIAPNELANTPAHRVTVFVDPNSPSLRWRTAPPHAGSTRHLQEHRSSRRRP